MSGADTTFLDANVLVYARDRNEPVKGPRAQALLSTLFLAGQPLVSVQVLSEFFWAATRKIKLPLSHQEAVAEARRLMILTRVVPMTPSLFERALDLVASRQLPLWDAQVIAAALSSGATTLLSEDFQHRQSIDGLVILNPFAPVFDESEVLGVS